MEIKKYLSVSISVGFVLSLLTLTSHAEVIGANTVREKAAQSSTVRIIAKLSTAALAKAKGLSKSVNPLATAQSTLVNKFRAMGARHAESIDKLPYVVLELNQSQVDQLVNSGDVDAVEIDKLSRPSLMDSVPLINGDAVWNLGYRGAGQTVAIVDTGVDATHPFLSGRVVDEACYSTTSASAGATSLCPNGQTSQTGTGAAAPCTFGDCFHGTHVAGIAAGNAGIDPVSGITFSGVAPDADIMAIQVYSRIDDSTDPAGPHTCANSGLASPCLLSYTSDELRALSHIYSLRNNFHIASVNMSMGAGKYTSYCDSESMKTTIDQLLAANIATVISAGNNAYTDAVSYPGCISSAITVGATDKTDIIAGYSNSATMVDLLAPGTNITSSVPGGSYQIHSGTSMAAPHVAGAIALMRSGEMTPSTLYDEETALKDTGVQITDSRNQLKKPRIDVLAALNRVNLFIRRYAVGDNGAAAPNGIAGYDLLSTADKVLPLDYDGDGKQDLFLYRPGSGAAWVAHSNGDGTFTAAYASGNGIAGYDLRSTLDQALAFDYDGDGKQDLFLYRPGSGAAWVARSNGDGTFTAVYASGNGIAGYDLRSTADHVLVFDYNGDGKDDLFLYRPGSGPAWVARSNGDGTFTTVYASANGIAGYDLHSSADKVIPFDYNGDGKQDLFLYRPGRGAAWVARSNGDGSFTAVYAVGDNGSAAPNGIAGYDLLSSADQVLAFDYNNDGKQDLFLYRPGSGAAWVARSNGDGTFTAAYASPNGIAGYDMLSSADRALSFDYNNDGNQDLFFYRPGSGAAWVAKSNGDGSFTAVYHVGDNGSAAPNGLAGYDMLSTADKALAFDFNGDGNSDLFFFRPGSGAAWVVESNPH